MATKSKNDWTLVWSLAALIFAAVSLGYCLTFIQELFNGGAFQSNRTIVHLTRLFKGGA